MTAPADDRNLLFGVLALQMNFISREDLVAAMNIWSLERERPLGAILVDRGGLDPADRVLLDAVVDRHVAIHQGDPSRSLASTRDPTTETAETTDLVDFLHCLSTSPTDDDRDLTTLAPVPASRAGGRFRILRPHKSGGLGRISVARDEELGRDVALKEIRERDADKPEFRARFVLEAEINGNLEHPAIVPVYGKGEHAGGRPFYAMRLIQGESLEDAIRAFHAKGLDLDASARSLRLRDLLGRFVTVCQAIAYAHARGVIHRDLKPANIMLGPYGETLLIDWGLAKATGHRDGQVRADANEPTLLPSSNDSHDPTRAGSEFGTLRYMSPEQAGGRLDEMGPKTDVYGLGATLYCVLTGKPPIAGPIEEVKDKVLRGDIVPLRKVKPNVPKALEAICLKALKLDPNDRYASAKDLARDIERWLADEPVPVEVYREPWANRAGRWLRRRKPIVAVVATLLVATIVGLAVDDLRVGRERDRAEVASKRAEVARKESDENFLLARDAVNKILLQVAEGQLPAVPQADELRRRVMEAAVKFADHFMAKQPTDPGVRSDAAMVYREAGNVYRMLGDLDRADEVYARAIPVYRGLEREPAQARRYAMTLALTLIDAGESARLRARLDEAQKYFREAFEIASARMNARPGPREPDPGPVAALALTDLAALRLEAGDPAKAAELSAEACRLFSLMKRAGVMDLAGFDLQAHMLYALALQTLGEAQHGLNRAADSEEALRESIAICNRALAAAPGTRPGRYSPAAMAPSFRFLRARSLHGLSRTLAADPARRAEAEDRATDAVEALDRLAEDAPKVEVYRKQRAASYRHRAALRLLGDKAKEAADDARKADEIDRLEAVPVRRDS